MTLKRYPQPRHGYDVEWHMLGCDCPACEPYRPSVAPRLGLLELGRIAFWGVITATAIAAIIWGPATVVRVLWANLTNQPL